ncbi:MAG: cyclic peptide export ABC transporter [Verrucomicrobiota bacterium JB022]|nr:cyclic peptide export ABC transporter [Verrucomicrobiota bacterium JB022]
MDLTYFKYLRKESPALTTLSLSMATAAGIAQAAVMMIVNEAAVALFFEWSTTKMLFLFLFALVVFVAAKRFFMYRVAASAEKLSQQIRLRIIDKLHHTELENFEQVGRSRIYNACGTDTAKLSEASVAVTSACASLLMVGCTIVYLAFISLPSVIIITAVSVFGYYVFGSIRGAAQSELVRARQTENIFVDQLSQLLSGFKEVKLDRRKADGLIQDDMRQTTEQVLEANNRAQRAYANVIIAAQAFFLVLIASVVFIVPKVSGTSPIVLMQIISATLFLTGPIAEIIASMVPLAHANVAIRELQHIEELLDSKMDESMAQQKPKPASKTWNQIELRDVYYHYGNQAAEQSSFSVGPLNLTLKQGEILFLVGGNGSGKTTLLSVLAGLRHPNAGHIYLDSKLVRREDLPHYRSHFAAVLSDFHLFRRLYGLDETARQHVRDVLAELEIADKTTVVGDSFTTIDLSTGQRKRVALAAAVAEDRPIYLFDEWAADQDPPFRDRFYKKILPELRASGKTIVVISHDDRYFGVADRIITMEYGNIASEQVPERQG